MAVTGRVDIGWNDRVHFDDCEIARSGEMSVRVNVEIGLPIDILVNVAANRVSDSGCRVERRHDIAVG